VSSPIDRLPGELVGGHEAQAPVRAVAFVVEQPVVHCDEDVVVVVEVPAVRELLPEAQVEALDNSVLLGAASIDIDRLDTLFGLWFDARRPLDNYWTRRGVNLQNLPNPAKAEAPFYWGFASKVAERMGFEVLSS